MKILKVLAIIVGVLLLAVVLLGLRGRGATTATHETEARLLAAPPDSVDLAEGGRLTWIYGCRSCHGEDLSGEVMIDAPPFLVVAPTLTRGEGGVGEAYGIADWDRAIRHGIAPDRRALFIMPSSHYQRLSDEHTGQVIAYLSSLPPVDRELPAPEFRPLGLVLAGAGQIDPAMEVSTGPRPATVPAPAATPEYGAHLAPGGRDLSEAMPSDMFRHMTDLGLTAIQAHLATLELRVEGEGAP